MKCLFFDVLFGNSFTVEEIIIKVLHNSYSLNTRIKMCKSPLHLQVFTVQILCLLLSRGQAHIGLIKFCSHNIIMKCKIYLTKDFKIVYLVYYIYIVN